MPKTQDFKALISEYIKKQMIILGPVVAVEKARKVDKIRVKDDGTVIQIIGEGKEAMAMVESEYESMIGSIAHTVFLRVIDKTSVAERETDNV